MINPSIRKYDFIHIDFNNTKIKYSYIFRYKNYRKFYKLILNNNDLLGQSSLLLFCIGIENF